jgi:4-alpha-glucanotransferase
MADRSAFLGSPAAEAWKKLGTERRAGILIPLFSLWTEKSVGVGEFPDLVTLADWCRDSGMSLIQLLPLNDVGSRFCPYDSESSFALEPMHLSLSDVAGIAPKKFTADVEALRERFDSRANRFDTGVKEAKLALLKKMFLARPKKRSKEFDDFCEEEDYWLDSYALYKALKAENGLRSWERWPDPLRGRQANALRAAAVAHADEIEFHRWLQWQLTRQFSAAARGVRQKKTHLLGDLPFLVARDSADVWAHPEYFKLGFSAGAPPDSLSANGQEWGMPPYHWGALSAGNYDYIKQKLRFASKFYDLYRLDHFVGLFRVWSFPVEETPDRSQRAAFDPSDEAAWEGQARGILRAMLEATTMLPCAEDLGTVPDIARTLLAEYAIPGMDVQRWMRDWHGSGEFTPAKDYRAGAIATLSTHDMTSFAGWWKTESTPEDRERFLRFAGLPSDAPFGQVLRAALEKASGSACIFSVQSFQDWMTFSGVFTDQDAALRVNRPGVVDESNWRLRLPIPVEEMMSLSFNAQIREMNGRFGRH